MVYKLPKLLGIAFSFAMSSAAMADYPVGFHDQYTIGKSASQAFDVLSNDTGTDLKIVDFNQWSVKGGRIIRDSSDRDKRRNLFYTAPRNGFTGEDEFWYVLEDAQGRRTAAKVKVPLKETPLHPKEDRVSVKKNTSIRINALANDSVVTSGPRTIVKIVDFNAWSKRGGRISLESSDSGTPLQFKYTPKQGFTGVDEFWYAISRSDEGPEAARVVINVTEYHSSGAYPKGKQDDVNYVYDARGTDYAYFPLDNDTGNNLRIVDRSGYSQKGGRYRVSSAGTLRYFPPSTLSQNGGDDKIWYVIEDALGRKNWSVINFKVPPFGSR
jgi:hypothetical protein